LKPDDHEILLIDGIEKALDLTDPALPRGAQTFAEVRHRLEEALRFDREHMWETFGTSMERDAFDALLNARFPAGIVATPLDPLVPFGDTLFFAAIQGSTVASLGFDLAAFWGRGSFHIAADPVLAFVNGEGATVEVLDIDVALDRRAAHNIVAHRNGADGRWGTQDDDPFDDLEELGRVPYVGRSALEKLRTFVVASHGSDARLLAFLNRRDVTRETLVQEVGLTRRAAEGIIAHRDGPDGRFGTPDDDRFDSVQELDAVRWVGPASLERLRRYVAACTLGSC
jgi:DNA uptake protein ComE-like DNA-binding protein